MRVFFITIILLYAGYAHAQLKLAKILNSNMVLQRDMSICIWGTGKPGNKVTVSFGKQTIIAVVQTDSSWRCYFRKQAANPIPQTIGVSDSFEKIVLKNILIGDVWVCLGQSNMEFAMVREAHFKAELKQAIQPLIRFYNPSFTGKYVYNVVYGDSLTSRLSADKYYQGQWTDCDSNSLKTMSAIGYYFGKSIVESEKVPVGLINLSIGGAPIETFISRDAMQHDPQFAAKIAPGWLTNDALPVWIRERGQKNVGSVPNVVTDDLGPNHSYKPGFAYTCGIAPMLYMPVKGIIWYQGESNSQEMKSVNEYGKLFALMVKDYRQKWKQPHLPFYWVQLSSVDTPYYAAQYWPEFRNEQRKSLDEIPDGGMAVCSDLGLRNNVHPTNKKLVGERLARWPLLQVYHHKIIPCGPLPLEAKYDDGKVVIRFRYAGKYLQSAGSDTLKGFSLDGKSMAIAKIQREEIFIDALQKPDFIYYGWKSFTDANLENNEGLPASTFKIAVK